jgi:hypothetical protein
MSKAKRITIQVAEWVVATLAVAGVIVFIVGFTALVGGGHS